MQIWPWWQELAEDGDVHGLLEVGVGEDDAWRVAAELQLDLLEDRALGGQLGDVLADGGGAGERDDAGNGWRMKASPIVAARRRRRR